MYGKVMLISRSAPHCLTPLC